MPLSDTDKLVVAALAAAIIQTKNEPKAETAVEIFNSVADEFVRNQSPHS